MSRQRAAPGRAALLAALLGAAGQGLVAQGAAAQAGPARLPDTLAGEPYVSLAGTRATVRFARRDSLLGRRLLELVEAEPPLPGLPDSVPSGVTVVLTHAPEAFDELTGGVVPEWRAGIAIPPASMLVIPAGEGAGTLDEDGLRTLRHEWAHLGLHDYLGDLRVPRWFDEGYAQWASGGFDATEAWWLRLLLAFGRAPPMDSLALAWPAGLEEARTAYLLAASAVTYLLEPAGERGLALFLERWRDSRSFEWALRRTFGVTPDQLEEDWRAHVRSRYGWLLVLTRSGAVWGFFALLLLLMARARRKRNREKLARLRAEEPPEEPAYWEDGTAEGGPGVPPAGV